MSLNKLTAILISILTAISFCGCNNGQSVSNVLLTDDSTPNTTVSHDAHNFAGQFSPASDYLSNEFNFYPEEVFYGDSVYITQFLRSQSDLPILLVDRLRTRNLDDYYLDITRSKVTIRYGDLAYNYSFGDYFSEWIHEEPGGGISPMQIPSHTRFFRRSLIVETPPLEEWSSPFWTKVREDVERDGQVNLTIELEVEMGPLFSQDRSVYKIADETVFADSHEITLKRRIPTETDLLDKWRQYNTAYAFPPPNQKIINGTSIFASDRIIDSISKDASNSGASLRDGFWRDYDIHGYIGAEVIDKDSNGADDDTNQIDKGVCDKEILIPYYKIMNVAHRKPPAGAAPTTAEGWLKLEDEFEPGVLRDEIHFANLMIKYNLALKSDADALKNAKQEIVDWLKSKPETQRFALIDYFYNGPLPSLRLFSELEEELDFPYKRNHDKSNE